MIKYKIILQYGIRDRTLKDICLIILIVWLLRYDRKYCVREILIGSNDIFAHLKDLKDARIFSNRACLDHHRRHKHLKIGRLVALAQTGSPTRSIIKQTFRTSTITVRRKYFFPKFNRCFISKKKDRDRSSLL